MSTVVVPPNRESSSMIHYKQTGTPPWLWFSVFLFILATIWPLCVSEAENHSNVSAPCSIAGIKNLISDLYAQHMKDYFNNGPSAEELLLNRKLLSAQLERIVQNDRLLSTCNVGNQYCIDYDLLIGGQDYWNDATHTLEVQTKLNNQFEVTVTATQSNKILQVRKLLVACDNTPKIVDFWNIDGTSELQSLLNCARIEHAKDELKKCQSG